MDLLARSIRQLRTGKEWSRERLEEESGIPCRTIARIEDGKTPDPGYRTVGRLLFALAGGDEAQAGILYVRAVYGVEGPLERAKKEETGSDSQKSPVPSEARSTA